MQPPQRAGGKAVINALIRCSLPQDMQHAKSLLEQIRTRDTEGSSWHFALLWSCIVFSKKMFPCVIQTTPIYYISFFCLIAITSQKTPSTKNWLSASYTDADYLLCTDLQRTHFNIFLVCHRLPINLMLSNIHIEFRVTAKNQDVPLDRKSPSSLYQCWTDNLNFHSII